MTRLAFPLLLLALGLAACDSEDPSDPPPVNPGEFRATVAFGDDEPFDLSGFASAFTVRTFFADSLFYPGDSLATLDSSTSFMITLIEADGEPPTGQPARTVTFMRRGSERLEPGSYPVGGFDRDGVSAFFSAFDRGGLGGSFFFAESGTLTLDTSTAERTAGSFSFRARYTPLGEGTGRTVTVSGSFDARNLGDLGGSGGYVPLP